MDARTATAEHRATLDSVVERLARRAVTRGDNTVDILLLSGGGQYGAYGAGFLRGWKARADGAPMPRFDLVTGVSTGALQAPFALIGTDTALASLSALYLGAAERIAPGIDWWFWLRRTGGLVKSDRLLKTIETEVNASMRDALRAEFRQGRQLAVGTADLDLGTGRMWDMQRVFDSTAAGLARAHRVFLSSAAIPGVFPPVVLGDGHVHTDGGVVANLLSPLSLPQYEALVRRRRASGARDVLTVRVWALLNTPTHQAPQVMDPASRRGVKQRADFLLFFAQQPQALEHLTTLERAVNSSVPGVRMQLRIATIPAELASEPAAKKLFDRGFMVRLEQLGYAKARSAQPWDSVVASPYERPSTTGSPP